MRRAGYEVRVLPEERGSWEENPPTMLRVLAPRRALVPGQHAVPEAARPAGPLSHEPLPARVGDPDVRRHAGLDADDRAAAAEPPATARTLPTFPAGLAIGLYLDLLRACTCRRSSPALARRPADARAASRAMAAGCASSPSAAIELVFSFLLGAVSTFRTSIFMIGLAVRQVGGLERAGARRARRCPGRRRARACGRTIAVRRRSSAARWLALAPAMLAWSLPLTFGYLLAIPFAVLTASPKTSARSSSATRCAASRRSSSRRPRSAPCGVERWRSLPARPRRSARSLEIYYRDRRPRPRPWTRSMPRFLRAGDLAFDIGAHVGDRIASFRRLGARVVALEPQPGPARAIRLIHGRDPAVIAAAGRRRRDGGHADAPRQHRQPDGLDRVAGFHPRRRRAGGVGGPGLGRRRSPCPCLTLDRLIRDHGRPAFVKIDVEGFEDRVLAGSARPVPALSFEFTTIAPRRGAALPRPARRARPLPLRRRARRGAKAHLRPLGFAGRDGGAPRRPSP